MVRADDRPIRDRLALIADPRERIAAKVAEVAAVLPDLDRGIEVARGDLAFRFQSAPQFIRNRSGEIIGIDATVRVFRGAVELQVDPHRICINPPCEVPDGTIRSIETFLGLTIDVENTREDPREAYLQWLEDSIRTTPNPAGFRTRGTVTTLYSSTVDGHVYGVDTVYDNAREGTGGFDVDAAASSNVLGQAFIGGTTYVCSEFFVSFDTSVIDDADDVTAVVLSLNTNTNLTTTDFEIRARAHDWGVALATADFVPGSGLSALALLATFATSGLAAVNSYNDFTENGANFRAAINKTGVTYVMLSSDRHESGTTPTGDEYLFFHTAEIDGAGTTRDPKLVVTHAVGADAPPRRTVSSINQAVARAASW